MPSDPPTKETALGLAFILLSETTPPDAEAIISQGEALGLRLRLSEGETEDDAQDDEDGPLIFEVEGGQTLMVMPIAAPHPDVPTMYFGFASPDREEAMRSPGHLIVTALGLKGDPRAQDAMCAHLTAAVAGATPSIGVMLGHGMMFYKAGYFCDLVAETPPSR
jgi:hypothetical protein